MPEEYKIVYEGNKAEIVEKKSRFIATVMSTVSEEEALSLIGDMRKKYWNASHNCFAYVIGEHCELQRLSDDGEPGGTAGRPILEVLIKEQIHDALIVVTRYFGGTLLGTGGLARAYSKAAKAGLDAALILTKIHGRTLRITADYTTLGRIQYTLAQNDIAVTASTYTDKASLEILVPAARAEEVKTVLTESTGARILLEEGPVCDFAKADGKIIIL